MSHRPLKVCSVVDVFPRRSETFIVEKFVGLVERGVDVRVVCRRFDLEAWSAFAVLRDRPALLARIRASNTQRGPTDALRAGRDGMRALRRRPRAVAATTAAALRHPMLRRDPLQVGGHWHQVLPLVELDPDVVHIEFGAIAPVRAALVAGLRASVVVSFRGSDICYTALDDPDHYSDVWSGADAVHFLGDDLRRRAVERGFDTRTPHALIPPAVCADRFPPADPATEVAGGSDRPLRVVSVGRLVWKKGYRDGLLAVAELRRRGIHVRYRIVGDSDGDGRRAVAHAVERLGLGDVVELAGWRSRDEVAAAVRSADVFLHPAVTEGFCNAVLEAQAAAVPVVCTDAEGLAENVEHGRTGFVVARRDSISMADRMAELAGDPALRARFGAAGRRRVREHFDPRDQLDRFVELYEAAGSSKRVS